MNVLHNMPAQGKPGLAINKTSVRKQSLCLLSFLYTSYIRHGRRAALKFGKYALLFSYEEIIPYRPSYAASFSDMCFLENI